MASAEIGIEGMNCDGCAERIQRQLAKEAGVRDADVSFSAGRAIVQFNPAAVQPARLHEVIEQAGFSVRER